MAKQIIKLELVGKRKLLRALQKKGTDIRTAAGRALYQEALVIMAMAKEETPVDTGALRASGIVHAPSSRGGETEVLLSFGDASVSYGEKVHEDMSAHHAVGKSKFLEDPARVRFPLVERNVAASIKRQAGL